MINWVFKLFVFLLPTQLAYHFWPDWAFVYGIRVDYLSPAIYLTDALFLLLFLASILVRKTDLATKNQNRLLVFGIIVFALFNILAAASPLAAGYKWLKVLEVFLIILWVRNTKGLSFEGDFLKPLFVSAAAFSLIGLLQFLRGSTLGGLLYFLGERSFNTGTPGISLVNLGGQDFLRPYSTFSHPNSLAGFLGIVLIFYLTRKKKKAFWPFDFVAISLILAGIFMSFSLGVWLGLLGVLIVSLLAKRRKFFFAKIGQTLLVLVVAASLLFPFVVGETGGMREELAKVSLTAFSKSPIFGVGLNNFIIDLPKLSQEPGVSWFLQPVHNIYLLIFAEAGIFGLVAFSVFLNRALKAAARAKNIGLFLALAFIVLVGAVDHYFLTLQQNILLFAVILGYSLKA